MQHRELLEALYRAGVGAADPEPAVERAVGRLDLDGRVALIALGKGACPMTLGAQRALRDRGLTITAGLAVSHEALDPGIPGVAHVMGDHPEPGEGSARAAAEIGTFAHGARDNDHVLVLLSGGATSLCAAPVDAVPVPAMRETFRILLESGAPITVMNAFRRRILRWAAGRLAVALHPARVHCLIVSDVMGNDLEAIGSGPCVPDPLSADDILALRQQHGLQQLPHEIVHYVRRVSEGAEAETPKPANPAFRSTSASVLLDNTAARSGVRSEASRHALDLAPATSPLSGEAAAAGRDIARELLRLAGDRPTLGSARGLLAVWGGETVVTITSPARGRGGRCQELALACAQVLHDAGPTARGITVLAAGTDGRDGPTDAAGAVVDSETWSRIAGQGRNPEEDLRNHDAWPSLRSANSLLITGATGTNVNDLVIGVIGAIR